MRWIVRVARNMDDVKECYFTDKEEALKRMEILKRLSMAVGATVWMEEINDFGEKDLFPKSLHVATPYEIVWDDIMKEAIKNEQT